MDIKSGRKNQYDKKILRIWTILNKIADEDRVSSRDLAKEFNVSIRTVQRDIELLNMSGFLVVSPEKGVHSFEEGFSLKKMRLTNEEASLLSFLYEIARSLGEKFEKSFQGILRKVISQEVATPFYAKVPEGLKMKEEYPYIRELEGAIEESKKITLKYQLPEQNKIKAFKLCPLKIVFYEGFWYLLSQVSGKDWMLKLRLERIKEVNVLGEYFVEPKNLKTVLDESVNIWFSEKRDKKVLLKIDKEAAQFFRQKIYFPLQKIKKENPDGSLTIEIKTCHHMEILPTVLHWIPHITVLEPKELIEEIKNTVKGYAEIL